MRRVVAYCKRHLAQEEKAKQNPDSKSAVCVIVCYDRLVNGTLTNRSIVLNRRVSRIGDMILRKPSLGHGVKRFLRGAMNVHVYQDLMCSTSIVS